MLRGGEKTTRGMTGMARRMMKQTVRMKMRRAVKNRMMTKITGKRMMKRVETVEMKTRMKMRPMMAAKVMKIIDF